MYYSPGYPAWTPPNVIENIVGPAPVYVVLIIGMVLFMAANAVPGLLPDSDRAAPLVLQWGFAICIIALCTQMLGLLPGVPRLHLTYVHMAIAFLLFFLMWNKIVSDQPAQPDPPAASSSSSSREKEKPKEDKKKERDEPAAPSPWDDLRAHPSAFLTTRLNRLLPWPFPMGRASTIGNELWWESGTPAHVGHFNRPDPAAAKLAEEEARKKKDKEAKDKEKAAEAEKAKAKQKEAEQAKAKAEEEAKAKARKKEEDARRTKEAEAAKRAAEEARRVQAIHDKHSKKLQRTKYLVMIVGISFLNRTFGFLLLLFYSLQIVSQELNPPPAPAPVATASASSSSGATGSSSSSSSSKPDADKEKLAAKQQAAKEAERAKATSSSGSASGSRPSSSSSAGKEGGSSSSSSRDKPSSSSSTSSKDKAASSSASASSSSKDKPVSSAAIREAAGTKTVTKNDEGSGEGFPINPPIGMHYIHTQTGNKLDAASFVPSGGMSHPLMTTTYWGYAG